MRSRVYFKLLTMSEEQWTTWNFNDQKFWKRVSRKGFSKCDTVSWKSDPISWKCELIFKNVPQFSKIVTWFSNIYDSLYDKKACRRTRISGSLPRFRVWCCLGPFWHRLANIIAKNGVFDQIFGCSGHFNVAWEKWAPVTAKIFYR